MYAVKFCGDFPEAEDIVQEVFVRFWDVYQEEAEGISARSYLYRMVRNACIDLSRAKKYETVDVGLIIWTIRIFFSYGVRRRF